MTRILLPVLFFLLLPSVLYAGGNEDVIKLASEAYARKEYAAAISLYEEAMDEGNESPELYYNLGNVYFQAGQIGPSVYCFEKAMKYLPADGDIRHNLRLAYSRIPDQTFAPKIQSPGWKEKFISSPGEKFWSWLCILALTISLLAYATTFRQEGMRKIRFAAHFCLLVSLSSFYLAMTEKNRLSDDRFAIILSPEVAVVTRQQHQLEPRKIILHEGTRVEIIQRRFGWCRITLGNETGWIPEQVLGVI